MTKEGGEFHNFNSRVLSVNLTENIETMRSTIKGYIYANDPNKTRLSSTIENPYSGGSYAKRLRNQIVGPFNGTAIKRTSHINLPVKEQKDLEGAMKKARIK
jgi:hypothetical protein